jgi:hypothetical protein
MVTTRNHMEKKFGWQHPMRKLFFMNWHMPHIKELLANYNPGKMPIKK